MPRIVDDTTRYSVMKTVYIPICPKIKKPPPSVNTPHLTTAQAAVYIGRSIQYLYNHRRDIPRLRKGIYRKDELDNWIARVRRKR